MRRSPVNSDLECKKRRVAARHAGRPGLREKRGYRQLAAAITSGPTPIRILYNSSRLPHVPWIMRRRVRTDNTVIWDSAVGSNQPGGFYLLLHL